VRIETTGIATLDAVHLEADVALVASPVGTAVIAHPHPRYGGDRHHPVVDALFHSLARAGLSTIRVDFRGAGGSEGVHDDGIGERLDVAAAIDAIHPFAPDLPLWVLGYSFGAMVALDVVDGRVQGWVAVAPPLGMSDASPLAASDPRPKLLLVPQHDQFADPDAVAHRTESWTACQVESLPMADHFLHGHAADVAARAASFVTAAHR
jgi:uncharacterized protein